MMSRLRLFFMLPVLAVSAMAQNGIYADFSTSMGDFSCRLEPGVAPKAVANFIGLATGERAWADMTGRVRQEPYYNGLTFHRVIKDFMIQGGSQDASGADGPGYVFQDEIGSLTFNAFGMLAMANAGADNNGAQFFVTVAPTVWLNTKHTIFGRLVSGSNVVYAISQVATGGSKPLTNVVINSVSIRRVGTDAQKFNINNQGLPIVSNVPLAVVKAQNQVSLAFTNRAFTEHRLYSTATFTNWSIERLGVENATPITNRYYPGTNLSQSFYRLVRAQYPNSTTTRAPRSLAGRKLVIGINRMGIITNNFDMTGTGTYAYGTNTGTILSHTWTQEPFHFGRLYVEYSGLYDIAPRLEFTGEKNGEFSGVIYNPFPTDISGLFYIE